jgi:hypothetical protein
MSAYTGHAATVYVEAQRLVPAVAAARHRGDAEGVQALYNGFLADAAELGIKSGTAWSILATAASAWVTRLLFTIAEEREQPMEEVITIAVQAALDWADSRA